QQLLDVRRKRRLTKHFFQIVDEMRTAQGDDAGDLRVAAVLEEYVLRPQTEAVRVEESVRTHPLERRGPEVRPRVVVGGVLGLVTDHVDRNAAVVTRSHERSRVLDETRPRHQRTVDER